MAVIRLPDEVRTAFGLSKRRKASLDHFGSYTKRASSEPMNSHTAAIFGVTIVVMIIIFPSLVIYGKQRSRKREAESVNRYMNVVVANEGRAEPRNDTVYGEGSLPGPDYGASRYSTAYGSRYGTQLGPPPAYLADTSGNSGRHYAS